MPDISVICSVKNGGKYLKDTVDSILRQTYTDWEFIIVDDGSTDDTRERLLQLAQEDKRIIVLPTGGPGRGKALNLALQHSRGSMIANIDADDPSHPQRLEILRNLLYTNQDYSLLGSSFVVLMEEESPAWKQFPSISFPVRDISPLLARRNPLIHSSVLVWREHLQQAGGYNEAIATHFDYELWIRMAGKGYRLGKVDLPLASKRAHAQQSFEAKKRFQYLRNSLSLQRHAIRELGSPRTAYLYLVLRLLNGLLPRILRQRFKRLASRIKNSR